VIDCYDVAPEESVFRASSRRRPAECNLNGVLLDRHPWDGGVCPRCGAVRRSPPAVEPVADPEGEAPEVAPAAGDGGAV